MATNDVYLSSERLISTGCSQNTSTLLSTGTSTNLYHTAICSSLFCTDGPKVMVISHQQPLIGFHIKIGLSVWSNQEFNGVTARLDTLILLKLYFLSPYKVFIRITWLFFRACLLASIPVKLHLTEYLFGISRKNPKWSIVGTVVFTHTTSFTLLSSFPLD